MLVPAAFRESEPERCRAEAEVAGPGSAPDGVLGPHGWKSGTAFLPPRCLLGTKLDGGVPAEVGAIYLGKKGSLKNFTPLLQRSCGPGRHRHRVGGKAAFVKEDIWSPPTLHNRKLLSLRLESHINQELI